MRANISWTATRAVARDQRIFGLQGVTESESDGKSRDQKAGWFGIHGAVVFLMLKISRVNGRLLRWNLGDGFEKDLMLAIVDRETREERGARVESGTSLYLCR